MLYRDSYQVNINSPPPEGEDVLRTLLGLTLDELAEAIAADPDGYAELYSERETA